MGLQPCLSKANMSQHLWRCRPHHGCTASCQPLLAEACGCCCTRYLLLVSMCSVAVDVLPVCTCAAMRVW